MVQWQSTQLMVHFIINEALHAGGILMRMNMIKFEAQQTETAYSLNSLVSIIFWKLTASFLGSLALHLDETLALMC